MPIAFKLVFITTLLMSAATIPNTFRSSAIFEKISGNREEDINASQAKTIADEVQSTLRDLIAKTKVVGGILYKNFTNETERETALDLSFRSDHDLVSVEVIQMQNGKPVTLRRVVNFPYL